MQQIFRLARTADQPYFVWLRQNISLLWYHLETCREYCPAERNPGNRFLQAVIGRNL